MSTSNPKHVLMIAYHFPPCRGSSGSLRTVNFVRYLPERGWYPLVLTANSRAYLEVDAEQVEGLPSDVPVCRAFALDASKHLAFKGRYPSWLGIPDRWTSWVAGGVLTGLRLIRRHKPRVIWVTYPVASALWIAYLLHRHSRLPLVTDLRDPLTEEDPRSGVLYPTDKKLWKARRAIESRSILSSSRTVVATPGSRKIHAERYSQLPDKHWLVIPNGYEESSFAKLECGLETRRCGKLPLRLLHSGLLYPTPDRDPSAFFKALSNLRSSGFLSSANTLVILRASGFVEQYQSMIQQHGIQDIVKLEPAIPYREALKEMLLADGLLVFQGYTSNPAIPAKLYEYLRARRPIFAMVDADGDTAATLRAVRAGVIVPLESWEQIRDGLFGFISGLRNGTVFSADFDAIRAYARESHASLLASVLDEVIAEPDAPESRG